MRILIVVVWIIIAAAAAAFSSWGQTARRFVSDQFDGFRLSEEIPTVQTRIEYLDRCTEEEKKEVFYNTVNRITDLLVKNGTAVINHNGKQYDVTIKEKGE